MFTRRARFLWLVFGVSDLILLAISFEIAYLIRAHLLEMRLFYLSAGVAAGLLFTAVIFWSSAGIALGVYRRLESFDVRHMIPDTIYQSFWLTVGLATAIYLLKLGEISRSFVVLFIFINFLFQITYRLFSRSMRRFLQREFAGYRYYLIVGTGPKAVEVARLIEGNEDRGVRVIGFVGEEEGKHPAADIFGRYPVRALGDLPRMLEEHIIDEVIFADSKPQLEKMEDLFLSCEEQGVKTRVLVDFFPHLRSEISLDKLGELPLLTFSTTPENDYLLFLKRVLDVVLAVVLLCVGAPALLVIAVLVRLASPGPAIYRQLRCGLSGRKFWLYKFRSMYQDADRQQHEVAHLNEMDGPVFKISRDPRVTPVGRFLRKTSLDEAPQLFNILKGDMSFVGPRPPLPHEVAQYEKWQRRRLRMKPGLTCLWALEGRNELNFARWMKLDMEYIDHWSLGLDFKILLRTIPRVLSGRGAS
jgi:exopolysaccharide biosynthesis polyprenyl glycosylphosphotransferase